MDVHGVRINVALLNRHMQTCAYTPLWFVCVVTVVCMYLRPVSATLAVRHFIMSIGIEHQGKLQESCHCAPQCLRLRSSDRGIGGGAVY